MLDTISNHLSENIWWIVTVLIIGVILFFVVRFIRQAIEKPVIHTKEKTETTKVPDKHGATGNTDHPHGDKEKGFDWFALISSIMMFTVCIIALMFFYWLFYSNRDEPRENNVSNSTTQEALVLISSGFVSPSSEWITPVIDYKFKFRSDGHTYNVQFSSVNGGWTKKVILPKEGDIEIIIPKDGTQGPAKITAGEKETEKFRVQLYKKVNL